MKKVFIITGANRGLGKAFADLLIQDKGNLVVSISRSLGEGQKADMPTNFYLLKADLAENTLEKRIAILRELIGDQEVFFINNASIIEPIVKIEDLHEEAMDRTFSVNIKSTMLITRYLLRHFRENKLSFVNISSGAANRPIGSWSLYCASKAFIQMFFNVAKSEYEQHRFFNIDPGVMETDMQKSIRDSNFPSVSNFKDLKREGKLRSTKEVALEIVNTIS